MAERGEGGGLGKLFSTKTLCTHMHFTRSFFSLYNIASKMMLSNFRKCFPFFAY